MKVLRKARQAITGKRVHPYVATYLASESLLYAALNLVTPFFALFVVADMKGGTIAIATTAMTAHFLARIAVELTTSRPISKYSEPKQLGIIIFGMVLVAASYIGFALSYGIIWLYIFWILSGIGWGISLPAKLSLFSHKLQKGSGASGAFGWAANDALNMIVISVATLGAGVLATIFGYRLLFAVAGAVNILPILVYGAYLWRLTGWSPRILPPLPTWTRRGKTK